MTSRPNHGDDASPDTPGDSGQVTSTPDRQPANTRPETAIEALREQLERKQRRLEVLERRIRRQQLIIDSVFNSKGWKLLNRYRSARNHVRFLPRLLLGMDQKTALQRSRYASWISADEQPTVTPEKLRPILETFRYRPKISIVMPVFDTRADWLHQAIASVEKQIYPDWELCICDDGSRAPHVRPYLEQCARRAPRIKVLFSEHNAGIADASNRALQLATGEFVGLLDHDDELSHDALFWNVELLQRHSGADFIYSDEDKLEPDGSRTEPFFKPDWSPEYLLSCMYTSHFSVYRKALLDAIGRFRPGFDLSQDYDLVLRASERTQNIFHIARVLYHWRKAPGSAATSAAAKSASSEPGRRAIEQHLERRGIAARVEIVGPNRYRVEPNIQGEPRISIIIPTKDRVELLSRCVSSITEKTTYHNYEILIVDNNSEQDATRRFLDGVPHRVLRFPEPFNYSRLNNFAVKHAEGDYLVLLNNDTSIISPDWLTAMLAWCQLPEIGIVGAKLFFPTGTIQHAGVVLGLGGVAGHCFTGYPGKHRGYYDSLAVVRNFSAVTAACMMVKRSVYDSVGGMDEKFRVAYNDVDFCLRVREAGHRIVWTPYAQLYHYEFATRGHGLDPKEVMLMEERWGELLFQDPYYNPNLTLLDVDFSVVTHTEAGDQDIRGLAVRPPATSSTVGG